MTNIIKFTFFILFCPIFAHADQSKWADGYLYFCKQALTVPGENSFKYYHRNLPPPQFRRLKFDEIQVLHQLKNRALADEDHKTVIANELELEIVKGITGDNQFHLQQSLTLKIIYEKLVIPLIHHYAYRAARKLLLQHDFLNMDDVYQSAMIGLFLVFDQHKPQNSAYFSQSAIQQLYGKLILEYSDEILYRQNRVPVDSIDRLLDEDAPTVDEIENKTGRLNQLAPWFNSLPLPVLRVYKLYYGDDFNEDEVAKILNISRSRVRFLLQIGISQVQEMYRNNLTNVNRRRADFNLATERSE